MRACEQAPGLNMLEHGQAVHLAYCQLIRALEAQAPVYREMLPLYARLKPLLPEPAALARIHLYHDCGKHLALTFCEGRRQYPNHAEISAEQYAKLFPEDLQGQRLIALDMAFHTCRGAALVELCQDPLAPILYLTAWAEINANALMFGGRDSDSYKIKRSRLLQAGKKLLNHFDQ